MFWAQTLSYLLVALINTGIALFILIKGVKKNYIKWIALTSFFTALYAFPYIFLMFRPQSGFLGKFTWIGIFAFPSNLIFVMEYIKYSRLKIIVFGVLGFLLAGLILIIVLTTNLIVPDIIYWYPQRKAFGYGPLHIFPRLYVIIVSFLCAGLLAKAYKKENPLQKEKIKYFLAGLFIFIFSAVLFTGVLPLLTKKLYIDFPLYFSSLWMILTIYAVYKYKLFEINFVIARSLLIAFVAGALIFIHITAGWMLDKILPNVLSNLFSTLLVAGIFFLTPFRYKTQAFFDRIFLKNRYQYLELIKNSIKVLNTFPNINALLEYIVQIVKTAFNPIRVAVLIRGTGDTYNIEVADGLPDNIIQQPVSDGLVIWLNRNRQTFIRDEWLEKTSEWHASGLYKVLQNLEAQICIPLVYRKEVKGILSMSNKGNGKTYTVQDIDLLEFLCTETATIIENSRLSYEATVDELTKLHHRRLFMPQLEEAVSKSKEEKFPIGILMIDVDYFKKINDTFGHLCGDEALKYIADILSRFCGSQDMVYRYGGEEFAVIVVERLRGNGPPEKILNNYAEGIRESAESSPFACKHGSLNITISIGATIFFGSNPDITAEDLIKKADSALYLAKEKGRNRVEFMAAF